MPSPRDLLQPLRQVIFSVGAVPYAALTSQPAWRTHGGELAALTRVRPGDRLLDLGCGPGESAFGMVDHVPGLRVTGLDASAAMVTLARMRQRLPGNGGDVTFLHGEAMDLPFPSGSFDAVVGHSFLYLVPDAARVLSESLRVLRPGGWCAFLEPSPYAGDFLPAEIARRTAAEPRFVASLALWRVASRGYGRYDEPRFRREFIRAGLVPEEFRATLAGLALYGVARKT